MNASGILESGVSTVVGESERELNDDQNAQNISSGNSTATGLAERTIVSSGIIESSQSSVAGLAENVIPAESGAIRASLSTVSGTGDRGSNSESATLVSGDATLSNTAERIIPAEDVEIINGSSSVTATTGRTIDASGTIQSAESNVNGASENIITESSANLQAGSVNVTGSADKVLTTSLAYSAPDVSVSGSGIREQIVSSDLVSSSVTVTGSASKGHETLSAVLESGQSSTTGLAEAISKGSGALETGASDVSGLSERASNASGALTTGTVTVLGAAVNEIPASGIGISGTSVLGPNTAYYVSYSGNNILVSGVPSDNTLNGTYTFLSGVNFRVTGTGNGTWTSDADYGVWERNNGDGTYDVIAYNDIVNYWSIFEETSSASSISPGDTPVDNASTAVADGDVDVGTSGEPSTTPALVTGTAGRTVVSVEANLTADEIGVSAVTGDAENIIVESDATIESGVSIVVGNSIRHSIAAGSPASQGSSVDATTQKIVKVVGSITSGSTNVAGLSERITSGSGSLESSESFITGLTVSGSNAIDGVEQIGESTVSGSGVRTSNGINTDLTADEVGFGAVTGDGENIIVAGIALVESGPSSASGTAKKAQLALDQDVTNSSSIAVGLGEREVVSVSQLQNTDSLLTGSGATGRKSSGQLVVTDVSEVSGLSERTIVEIEANLTAAEIGFSVVTGDGENIIVNVDATVSSGQSEATGLGERTLVIDNGIQKVSDSVISSIVEIASNLLSTEIVSNSSTVSGVAENVIVSQSIELSSQEVTVTGISERTNKSSGEFVVGDSIAVGSGVRTSNGLNTDLTADEVGFGAVTGDGENIIVNVDATVTSSDASASGNGIRTGNLLETDAPSQESTVNGVATRTVEDNLATHALVVSTPKVAGVAERKLPSEAVVLVVSESSASGLGVRHSNVLEGDITAQEVGISVVSGIAENIIVTADGSTESGPSSSSGQGVRHSNGTGTLVSGASSASGLSERQSDAIGSIASGLSSITGLSERTINNIPNVGTVGDLVAFGPDDNGPSLWYITDYKVLYDGTGEHYDVLNGDKSFTLKVSFNNLVVQETSNSVAKDYNIYWRDKSGVLGDPNRFDVIFFSTTAGRWYQEEFAIHPAEWYDGQVLESYVANNTVELTSIDAKRTGNASSRVYSSDSFIAAVGDNIIPVVKSDVASQQSEVEGVGKIDRLPTSLDYKMPDAIVSGLGERTLNNDGLGQQLFSDPSSVVGLGERTLNNRPDGQELFAGSSVVVGLAERTLNNDGLGQELFSDQSTVNATVKITTFLQSGVNNIEDSKVVGVGERTLNNKPFGQALVSGQSSVVGVAERILNRDGTTQELVADESIVIGIAKRSVVLEESPSSQDSKIYGLSERTVNLVNGISDADGESYKRPKYSDKFSYVGANLVATNVGSANGTYLRTNFRFVAGYNTEYHYVDDVNYMVYEKDNGDGTFNVLMYSPIDASWCIWVNETVSVSDASEGTVLADASPVLGSTETQDYIVNPGCTTPSKVSGVAERILNNDNNGQALFSGPATVNSVGQRTIVRLPDFLGPLGESPSSNDSNVSYVGTSLEVSNFLGGIAFFNGIYEQVYYTGHFTESGTSDYVFHKDTHNTSQALHNWYVQPSPSFGGWFVALHNESKHEWYVTFSSTNPYEWKDGDVLPGLRGVQSLLAINSEERPTGFKSMQGISSVVGTSERVINPSADLVTGNSEVSGSGVRVSNDLNAAVKSGDASTSGVTERQIDPVDINLTAGEISLSFVTAVGERVVIGITGARIKGGPADVSGKGERKVVATGSLVSDASTVSGSSERQSDQEGPGTIISGPSIVSGVSERKVVATGSLQAQFTHLNETEGEAERVVVVVDGSIKSDDSTITGVAKRTINTLPEPISGEVRLYAGNNRPWQYLAREDNGVIKPRVDQVNIYQTVGFQEAIPVYRRILVRAPRKYGGNRN